MQRRSFLATLGLPALAWTQDAASANDMKIAAVEMWRYDGRYEAGPAGAHRQHQVQPNHIYDELRPKPYREPAPSGAKRMANASAYYLKIKTKGGLEGIYGPIDKEGAIVVDQQLKTFLIGKNALAGEALWDQMHRSNRHSRASHFMIAISAVDNALWDLRGRYFKAPVYRLLGGPTRPTVEAYGSTLGYSVEPEVVRQNCAEFYKQGFRHQKWFLAYGPGDGMMGLERNIELVKTLRETLGGQA